MSGECNKCGNMGCVETNRHNLKSNLDYILNQFRQYCDFNWYSCSKKDIGHLEWLFNNELRYTISKGDL